MLRKFYKSPRLQYSLFTFVSLNFLINCLNFEKSPMRSGNGSCKPCSSHTTVAVVRLPTGRTPDSLDGRRDRRAAS
jgi:hypothetical protein